MSTEIKEEQTVELNDDINKSNVNDYSLDSIKKHLNSIDAEYEATYPSATPDESTMPQYQTVQRPTYDQIEEEARNSLGVYEASSKQEIQNDYNEELSQIAPEEEEVISSAESSKAEAEAEYKNNIETNRSNMISQGVERSSIVSNTEQSIESDYNRELVDLIEKTQLSLSELELKKSIAQNEMNTALDKFDIAYAAKLEKKIEDLSSKYDQQMLDLEKYNLEIAELRNKRNEEWKKWVNSQTSAINAEKSRAKVEYLIDSIKKMTKEEAVNIIYDPEIVASLGEHYQIVLDYVNRRKQ